MRDLCGAESVRQCSWERGVAWNVQIAEGRGIRESDRLSGLEGLKRGGVEVGGKA